MAMLMARRLHRRLRVDLHQRIDIFQIVRDEGILLGFTPLEGLAGAYIRPGGYPGILINSQHPLSKQRYTVAHEFGHHVFGHSDTADVDTESLFRLPESQVSDVEKVAESFAAWMLMPDELVRTLMAELETDDLKLPVQVYELALRLGTSYQATIHQLRNLRLVSASEERALARIAPRDIKQSLTNGAEPPDFRRNVWSVDIRSDRTHLLAESGDRVVVFGREVPSSGAFWRPTEVPDGVELVADSTTDGFDPFPEQYERLRGRAQAGIVGDELDHAFALDLGADEGTALELRFVEGREWQAVDDSKEFRLSILLEAPRTGLRVDEAELVLH